VGIVLYRVDERLIHGQVVVGWGSRLDPARYVVVDDALAGSAWEQELFLLAVEDEAEVRFCTVAEGRAALPAWQADPARTLLLTRDVPTMAALAAGGGLRGTEVNLGGIHHAPGRTEVRSYLYLDDEDREALRRLDREGVAVSGRDLPDTVPVELDALLGTW
jgi:PTS system mannose-specific IIB component/fructoselysine and glucoselysine-specific PTS system IIB component